MGMHGFSTRQVILDNVHVPVENVLGEVGKGHKIAFNVLNVGRFKLGAFCVGQEKYALSEGARYANERQQFNVPISSFGAIREKRTFSRGYRDFSLPFLLPVASCHMFSSGALITFGGRRWG